MEIEVSFSSAPPDVTVGLAFNIAHYLLDHGAVLKHGQYYWHVSRAEVEDYACAEFT